MAFYVSPLVDIKEVDLSNTITAASSSIACLVVRNPWRGKEGVKYYTTNDGELFNVWGNPTNSTGNYEDLLSAQGYHIFGNALYTVGVRNADATYGGLLSTVSTAPSASFASPTISGNAATTLTPADLAGGDVDTFAEQFNPVNGPMEFISTWRGASANRIRIGIVDEASYDKMVRQKLLQNWAITPYVMSLDTIIEKGDRYSFLVIVQFCPQGSDTTDDNQWSIVEVWNVSTKQNALDEQGRPKFAETKINGESKYLRIALKESQKDVPLCTANTPTFTTPTWRAFAGGYDGTQTLPGDLDTEIIKGYNMFANPEEIDINIFIESDKSMAVKQALNQICIERKDCMAILDCQYAHVVNQKGSEATNLVNYRLGLAPYVTDNMNLNSDRVAAYGNWLEVYDQYNRKYRWIPASGYMAGIWANNDNVSDPWFAPAGLNRAVLQGSIRRLAWNPTLGQRDLIYKNGWNPLVSFAGQGKVAWGQKTLLDKNSSFNRINVRRLFLVIEKACATAAKYFLFEPNDPFTRLQIKNMVEPFLRDVKGRRGVYDYRVVCDESNNTNERIDRNELWVDIMIQPTKTAEFIVLRFTATKTGASFSEVASGLNG